MINLGEKKGFSKSSVSQASSRKGPNLLIDLDHNEAISLAEMRLSLEQSHYVRLLDEEIRQLYNVLGVIPDRDGALQHSDVPGLKPQLVDSFVHSVVSAHPERQGRYSETTWLSTGKYSGEDPLLVILAERVPGLLELPEKLGAVVTRGGGLSLQLVRYPTPGGHYVVHLDGADKSATPVPCCHVLRRRAPDGVTRTPCRNCRFATLLSGTTSMAHFMASEDSNATRYCDPGLSNDDVLRIIPKKGRAVLFYNYDVVDGWVGTVDTGSMHGSCPVSNGSPSKIIANHWIEISDDREDEENHSIKLHAEPDLNIKKQRLSSLPGHKGAKRKKMRRKKRRRAKKGEL